MRKIYKNKGLPRPTTQTRFFNEEFKTKEERIKNLFITDGTYLYINKDLSEDYFLDKQHYLQFMKNSDKILDMKIKVILGHTYTISECLFYLANGYIPERLFIDKNKHYDSKYLLDFPEKYFYKSGERIKSLEYFKECFGLTEDNIFYFKQRPKYHFRSYEAWKRYNTTVESKTEFDNDTLDGGGYKILSLNARSYVLHRIKYQLFLDRLLDDSEIVDHIDRNKINNSIDNLRVVDAFVNAQNKSVQNINKTSKYKGVYLDKSTNLFMSKIVYNGKYVFLGGYQCEEEAALAYDKFIENNNLETTTNKMLGLL